MATKLREISQNELQEILKQHQRWVESAYKEGERADLSGADLSGADLSLEADLSYANLFEANLFKAKLSDADLTGANLTGTNLTGANLMRADLSGADFSNAKLSDTDLTGADFSNANLTGADLFEANLTGANLFEANLEKSDIYGVNFTRARLQRTNLLFAKSVNSTGDGPPVWKEAYLEGAIMDGYTYKTIPNDLKEKYKDTLVISNVIESEQDPNSIIRSIEFPPEHHAAGMTILQNFGKLLRDKYPDQDVGVTIKQEGLKVTMVITSPEGQKEEIEEYLDRYGLVVKGDLSPEEFVTDPIQVLELKSQLRIAKVQLEEKQALLQYTEKQHEQRITTLEDQLKLMQTLVSEGVSSQREIMNRFFSLLESQQGAGQTLKEELQKKPTEKGERQVKQTVAEMQTTNPDLHSQIGEFVMNTVASAGANAPGWISFLAKLF